MKQALTFCALLLVAGWTSAQPEITVVETGLRGPVGIDSDGLGNFLIAQQGSGQDDSEISVYRPGLGLAPLVVNLPSRFDTVLMEIRGSVRAQALEPPYFIVFNGVGVDTTGPVIFLFDASEWAPGSPLTPDDAKAVFKFGEYVYGAGFNDSNPYTLVHDGCNWYIADAGANAIFKRDGLTGLMSPYASLPNFPNPTPVGPPFIQPVPTRIIADPDGGFYVSSLTGFPFVPGASNIWHVDDVNGAVVFDTAYSLVTDMALHPSGDGLLTLRFAEFNLGAMPPFAFNSAMILHTREDGTRDTIASGFGPSAGMAMAEDDIYYVTEVFTGRLLKIDTKTTAVDPQGPSDRNGLMIYPNPARDQVSVSYHLPLADDMTLAMFDLTGRRLASVDLGFRDAGVNQETLSISSMLSPYPTSQTFYIRLTGASGWSVDRLLVVHP